MSINPGSLFEDVDLHPVVCLDVSHGLVFAVSLVDGSCRTRSDAEVAALMPLSVTDAITWRFSGPSRKELVPKSWWKYNKGIDPFAHDETFPESLPVNAHDIFRPGDFYVGSFWHPCLCLWIVDGQKAIAGVSLIAGTYPKQQDLLYTSVWQLTPQGAWIWRTRGPQDGWWSEGEEGLPAESMRSTLTETENPYDPNYRWWPE